MVLERVELQARGQRLRAGQLGAFGFQRWLYRWRGRPFRILVALDGSHAIVVPRRGAAA